MIGNIVRYTERFLVIFLLWFLLQGSFLVSGPEYLSPLSVLADKEGRIAYVAMSSANRVAMIDLQTGLTIRNINISDNPTGLALSQDQSHLYITAGEATGMVYIINLKTFNITGKIKTGHSPSSPVVSPDGKTLYVPNRFNNNVSVINLTNKTVVRRIPVHREPVATTLTPDGKFLFVANFLPDSPANDDHVAASVSILNLIDGKEIKVLHLPNGSSALRGMVMSPDGKFVYVTHLIGRSNLPTTQLDRGWMNTNAITIISVDRKEIINSVLLDDLDRGAANPWGVVVSNDGRMLIVAHSGTHEISIIDRVALHKKLNQIEKGVKVSEVSSVPEDVQNDLSFLVGLRQRVPLLGKGPRGLAIAGGKILVTEYFSDELAIIVPGKQPQVRTLPLGGNKELSTDRQGSLLFNDATNCFQSWQSCASCHPDGRADALNWNLMNIGLGRLRNTKSLLYSQFTPPVMSHGIRATAEVAVRSGFKYIMFAPLSEDKASMVDVYLKNMKPTTSPYLVEGKLNEHAQRGKEVFERAGCINCHSGQYYTNCKQYDLGTLRGWEKDIKQPIDVPGLTEVWRTAPYLHDGRALTVKEAFQTCNPKGAEVLTELELIDLTEYVLSL
jgi:YVTN family beta-propeller protein